MYWIFSTLHKSIVIIVVCHIIKRVFQTAAGQFCHLPVQILLEVVEKAVKMVQCAVDVRKFELASQTIIIQKPGGRLPFGGRVEDPVHDKIAEHLVQGIFPTESGMFLVIIHEGINFQKAVYGFREFIPVIQETVVSSGIVSRRF